MNRTHQISAFINAAGWGSATVTALAGDASNRKYDRLTKPDGTTAVLMNTPPVNKESVEAFVKITQYLSGIGASAPTLIHQNVDAGLLLIEDLGDQLFTKVIAKDPSLEKPLYLAAADILTHLHQKTPPDLRPYSAEMTAPLAALAYDWYQLGASGSIDISARNQLATLLTQKLEPYDNDLSVVILRDYHAENLLWLPDRSGHARVGLLDFQDAMLGHPAYDLVSVLQDARRDVCPVIAEQIKNHFVTKNRYDPDLFEDAYAIFGLQRNLRILGVFSRLCMRDGKSHYIDLIPRVWRHVQTNLEHTSLSAVASLIAKDLPAPTHESLSRLKEKSGLWVGQ
ncbi:MAG: phosphotransferase [Roseobacter sp.]